ncbi:MAG: DNA recombination-mediator protein A [Candidatus Sericytochromatia bacterium]
MAQQSGNADTITDNKLDTFFEELQLLQSKGSKKIALIGSRHISLAHQQLIETLAYALALEGNEVITSGASGTNFAVIKGVQRANPDNLIVILPQTIEQQPDESREQLLTLKTVIEYPERTNMTLAQASELCYTEIISKCQQLVVFLYHTSMTLKQTIQFAHEQHKIVTAFYLD